MRNKMTAVGMLAAVTVLGCPGTASADDTWRAVPLNWTWPDRHFNDVEAVGARDVWAAGGQGEVHVSILGDLGHAPVTLVDIGSKPVLQHWTGGTWTSYSPPGIPGEGQITQIEGLAPNDVWASGFLGYHNPATYLAHWDGTRWTQVASPSSRWSVKLWTDSDSVWLDDDNALYQYKGGAWIKHPFDGGSLAVILPTSSGDFYVCNIDELSHWNGSTFTTFGLLPGDSHFSDNNFYAASAAGELWTISRAGSADTVPSVHRWSGTAWETVPVPDAYQGTSHHSIYDVDGIVIQVRTRSDGKEHQLRWNGTSWTELSTPAASVPPSPVVAGDGTVWAGGGVNRLQGQTWTPVQVPITGYLQITPLPASRYVFAWGRDNSGNLVAATNTPQT
ncbi:MAG: hypothetical protein ABIS86_00635, partial [Streptosporangiaceae bacterium]